MELFPHRAAGSAPTARPRHGHAGVAIVTSRLWYRAELADAVAGARHVPMIGEHFADVLGAAGWPEGACLFLSGSHAIFFSPAAIAAVPQLIVACGAEPSLPPARAGATLLVGKDSDWNLLPHELH